MSPNKIFLLVNFKQNGVDYGISYQQQKTFSSGSSSINFMSHFNYAVVLNKVTLIIDTEIESYAIKEKERNMFL